MSSNPNPPVLTVSQLTQAIRLHLESAFSLVWLQGEVSNCKLQSSGHLYFSLKDSQAQISAVMFRGDTMYLPRMPRDGDQILVRGELNVYPPAGRYQVIVRELRYSGIGALLLKLEERKAKLQNLGWFDKSHKKPLPKFPKIIGVVTSPTGAVIQDILNVLSRRFSGFRLILNPVKVQGEGAAAEIAKAIEQMNRFHLCDVMIVGRGGGSIEDLWAFNEEIVAEAIFKSKIPIISAVGHETDYCIADFVADVRAPTPSAAAEMVIAEKTQQLQHLANLRKRLIHTLFHLIRHDRERLAAIMRQPFFLSPYNVLGPSMQKLDDVRQECDRLIKQQLNQKRILLTARYRQLQALRPTIQLAHYKSAFVQRQRYLDQQMSRHLQQSKERLLGLVQMLQSLDPRQVLNRGYCILLAEKDRSIITSIQNVEPEQDICVILADGELIATTKQVAPSQYVTTTE